MGCNIDKKLHFYYISKISMSNFPDNAHFVKCTFLISHVLLLVGMWTSLCCYSNWLPSYVQFVLCSLLYKVGSHTHVHHHTKSVISYVSSLLSINTRQPISKVLIYFLFQEIRRQTLEIKCGSIWRSTTSQASPDQ